MVLDDRVGREHRPAVLPLGSRPDELEARRGDQDPGLRFNGSIFREDRLRKQVDETAAVIRDAVKEESDAKLTSFDKSVAGEIRRDAADRGLAPSADPVPVAPERQEGQAQRWDLSPVDPEPDPAALVADAVDRAVGCRSKRS